MFKNLFFFVFIILISCNNNIPEFNNKTNLNILELNKTNKPYVLKDTLIVPKNHTLIIKNGVEFILKKNGVFINNGSVILGEKTDTNILDFFNKKNLNFSKVSFFSKKKSIFYNNGEILFYNSFFKNISFFNKKNVINIFNSYFLNCDFISNFSEININNCLFNNVYFLKESCYNFSITNSIIYNSLKLNNINCLNSFNINKCALINTVGFNLNIDKTTNISNSFFLKNSVVFNINKSKYFKIFNNIFKENKSIINLKNKEVSIYLINNTFDGNNYIIKNLLDKNSNKIILSKNNIFYNNDNYFNNLKVSNNFCISNNIKIDGYFNLNKDPLFEDSKKNNYKLKFNSPAIKSGTNNTNLGANINDINIIKYLKY